MTLSGQVLRSHIPRMVRVTLIVDSLAVVVLPTNNTLTLAASHNGPLNMSLDLSSYNLGQPGAHSVDITISVIFNNTKDSVYNRISASDRVTYFRYCRACSTFSFIKTCIKS